MKKFYEAVSQDESLKQKFVEISQKYQGQPMDEAEMKLITEEEVLPIAKQAGYSYVFDDLITYELEMKQTKTGSELSDEKLQAVSGGLICAVGGGGGGVCVLFGYSPYGICCIIGLTL